MMNLSWMILILAVGLSLYPLQARSATDHPLAKAPPNNVLLIVSDDLKASVLECYGDPLCKTPNLNRLAREGMLFRKAYCQGTWCAPSRQSFMHSRYQGTGEVNLGQHLIRHGFYSARVGKIFHMRVPGDIIAGTDGQDVPSCWTDRFNSPGLEAHTPGDYACLNLNLFTTKLEGRQSTQMPHRPYVTVSYQGDGSDQPDFKSADKAIELLRQQAEVDPQRRLPFFLAVGFIRPHYPMVAPKQYFDNYPWNKIQLPATREHDLDDIPRLGWGQSLSNKIGFDKYPQNQKGMWSGYYASVTFMDDQLGRLLSELDRLNLRETTTVIFTSDHGYHLGEHGFWQKSNLHEEVTRVPLIIDQPGMPPGETDSLVELVDLFPTIAEIGGVPIPDSVQGKSLVPILGDATRSIRESAISLHKGIAVRTSGFSYLRYIDGTEEFYDMSSDPHQFDNLIASDTLRTEIERHRKLADQRIARHQLKSLDN